MALDKQRILNELGSVMSQLKSADCGCMGKLFGNSGQTTAPPSSLPTYGGCRRSCCHDYGWNSNGSCGEPSSSNVQNMYGPCMSRCNPPKLYADTYNYLNENLMQPTVKEIYNDLKSLTPANTVVNNPLANQMGISNDGFSAQNDTGAMSNQNRISNQLNMGNKLNDGNILKNFTSYQPKMASKIVNESSSTAMNQMGGMGPQIMNMFEGNTPNPHSMQHKPLSGPMVIDAPESPYGQVGVMPLSAPMGTKPHAYNANVNSYNANQAMNPVSLQAGGNGPSVVESNPAQMAVTSHHAHGQHARGVAQFHEMFPGVMKDTQGGGLDFDPMSIALQMNPANQQAAINTMQKMIQKKDINKGFDQTANAGTMRTGVAHSSPASTNAQQNMSSTNQITYQNNVNYKKEVDNNENVYGTTNAHISNQQLYHAGLSLPITNQQSYLKPDQQQTQNSLQYGQQCIIDPNTGSGFAPPTLPSVYEYANDPQNITTEAPNVQNMIKEPLFPVDTSRFTIPKQKFYEYNTLGQPVEMLSSKMYRTAEPALPQTLSPQPTHQSTSDQSKYSKVKSTVSKTSLVRPKPIGRTPSQLQQIYKQYKGSQSYTQQNIVAPAVNDTTHSEGKLIAAKNNVSQPQRPVENIGDTAVNNQLQYETTDKVEHVIGHTGGVPDKGSPLRSRKCRNGLQDVIYPSYPTSAAWSFHGVSVPYTPGRRYRKHY